MRRISWVPWVPLFVVLTLAIIWNPGLRVDAQREPWANNAASTLASGITNVATSLTVASGEGGRFPSIPLAGEYFWATIESGTTREIVKVTGRSTDTFTIVRGQQGTANVAWSAGAKIEQRLTAMTLNRIPIALRVVNNFATTSLSFVDVMGASVEVGAYIASCDINHFSSGTTIAPHFAFNGPAASDINYHVFTMTTTTAVFTSGMVTAYDTVNNPATGVVSPGAYARVYGMFVFTATGTLTLRLKAEAAGTVTIVEGSSCVFQRIS